MNSSNHQMPISFSHLLLTCGLVCVLAALLGCGGAVASEATAVPTLAQSEPPSSSGEITSPPKTVSPGSGGDAPVNSQQPAPPQKNTGGKIVGHVFDHQDKPIARATVGISKGTAAYPERAYLTDDNGMYSIGLPPGKFTVFVNAEGFAFAEQEAQVEQSQETTLDFHLKPQ